MTLSKGKAASAVLAAMIFLGTGVVVTLDDARGQNAAAGATGADLREKAQARVRAAEKLLAALENRLQAGEAITPLFLELQGGSMRRLAEARIDATDDPAARVRAVEQYVQQCRDAQAQLEKRMAPQDFSLLGVAQGAYQLADAEYLLAKMQGADLRPKAQARVRPAENVLTRLEQRVQANEVLSAGFIELRGEWARRLAQARIDATDDPAARVRTAEEDVQQCRLALVMLERRRFLDVTRVQVTRGEYALADAEYLLAKMQGADVRPKAQARVRAAENVPQPLEQTVGAGAPLTTSLIEHWAGSHRRLAEARMDATDEPAARVRAAEQYIQQCRDMLAILEKRKAVDVGNVQIAQGEYYLADAEYLLAKIQGK